MTTPEPKRANSAPSFNAEVVGEQCQDCRRLEQRIKEEDDFGTPSKRTLQD